MKKILFISCLLGVFFKTAIGQQHFSAEEFKKNLGKTGTLCDTVLSLKIVSDTLTLLQMGRAYPDKKYVVAVKGNQINLDWTNLPGKQLCITGVFEMYKGQPGIEISDPERINMK